MEKTFAVYRSFAGSRTANVFLFADFGRQCYNRYHECAKSEGGTMEQKRKCGLVLEGGGTRGIYTAGVLDVFMEEGITFDGVIGVSAGAIHGASYVSGQKGRSIRYYKKYCSDPRFMSWRNFFTKGDVVDVEFCYHEIPERLEPYDHDAFETQGMEFYVGCSNVETGQPECLRITDFRTEIDKLRASASLPYVSKMVEIDGRKLMDGGCTDSVPVRGFMKLGYKRNVVVLTRHKGYVKKPENRWMAGIVFRKYPAFAKALKQRHLAYNKNIRFIERLEQERKVFVIRPSVELSIGRMEHDPERLQEVYDIGRQDARKQLDAMKKWREETLCKN